MKFFVYDRAKFPRRYDGETRLRMSYETRSNYRWRVIRGRNGTRTLIIYPRVRDVELLKSHEILLPEAVVDSSMFDHPLVRHELDHVRVSSDPRFEELFRKWIRDQLRVIRVPVPAEETDLDEIAQEKIKSHIKELFDQVLELVQIRYRELDQVTEHGAKPLPPNFFEPEPDA